jgi:hypothetical protein
LVSWRWVAASDLDQPGGEQQPADQLVAGQPVDERQHRRARAEQDDRDPGDGHQGAGRGGAQGSSVVHGATLSRDRRSSLLETVLCWTRAEWAEQGVDVDKDWATEGVAIINDGAAVPSRV